MYIINANIAHVYITIAIAIIMSSTTSSDDDPEDKFDNILDIMINRDITVDIHGGSVLVTRYRNDHNAPTVKDNTVQKLIPDVISECALGIHGDVCSTVQTVKAIAAIINVDGSKSSADIMHAAKKQTDCDDERCVLQKLIPKIGENIVRGELKTNFKIVGPTDNKLLSNVNIDDTLTQWITKFSTFFPYNFNMLNYASYAYRNQRTVNEPDTLATKKFSDLYNKGSRTMACVINSDTYQGNGKHWMALFADARGDKWTVEFFNSSGNPPAPEWVNWLVKTKAAMEEFNPNVAIVKASSFRHQQSRTECGVYSLFYIWARLQGTPVEYFRANPIPDQLMLEFRQHVFHDPTRTHVKKFDWDAYNKSVKVTWE